MNKNIFLIALAGLALAITSCSNTIKKTAPHDKSASAGDGSYETIVDSPVEGSGGLGSRPEGINPENADYETLAIYTVYFDYDSYDIKPVERSKLEHVAKWLSDNSNEKLILAGHTDKRGTTQYNLGLGERRSLAVRGYLIGLGVGADRLHTISYGEERPAISDEGESAFAKNRRVQIGVAR